MGVFHPLFSVSFHKLCKPDRIRKICVLKGDQRMFENLFVDTYAVLVELTLIPMGNGQSNIQIADMLDIFDESGLFYEHSRNSACIEGKWNEISPLIFACYERVQEQFPQGFLRISLR